MALNDPIEVLITLPFKDELVKRLVELSPRLEVRTFPASSPDEVPPDVWATAEILYTDKVLPGSEQAPNLQWIQFHWAGIDHATHLPLLKRPGLATTTISGASATQMAEYIVMMILALGHRLPSMIDLQKKAKWSEDRWDQLSPIELRDSTVGIVGYGSVGRQLAHLLFSFGARVLATKRDVRHPVDSGYSVKGFGDPQGDYVHRLYPPEALGSMLSESDFVVVCVPLAPGTRNLLNAGVLAKMKATACLIDVSRGGVVDHDALSALLEAGKIGGAALDVFPEEPLPADSQLWRLQNVLLTPHISGTTRYYDERAVDMFCENLLRYLAGSPLYNQFDPAIGY